MPKFSSDSSRGFSLIEMLVVITVVLLLSGLTVGGMRALRTHQVVAQAAGRFEMLLELAQALAMSEGESVYLVIADHKSEPPGVPMRAYTLIKNPADPVLLHNWQFLPRDVVFADDDAPHGLDLIGEDPILVLQTGVFWGHEVLSPVEGSIRVLVKLTPGGRFLSGPSEELQSASLLLERGSWESGATLNQWTYQPHHEKDDMQDVPLDAVRILFRPRSGMIQIEDKTEAAP